MPKKPPDRVDLHGVWILTVRDANEQTPAFPPFESTITFNSDGTLIERSQRELEPGTGLWQADDHRGFHFMFLRYVHDLTVAENTVNITLDSTARLRSSNTFRTADSFRGTGTVDVIDAQGNIFPNVFRTKHEGVRLVLLLPEPLS